MFVLAKMLNVVESGEHLQTLSDAIGAISRKSKTHTCSERAREGSILMNYGDSDVVFLSQKIKRSRFFAAFL